jgi:rhodanese-related sulfurtransferase
MKLNLKKMGRNAKLGLLACLLGLIAAFAGNPYKGTRVTIDATDLAGIVQREVDHINPVDLADWIVKGQSDYRLIDLRSKAEYDQYHIPSAESVPLAGLPDYGLGRSEKIVLYSEGGIHSAQAWFLLKAMDYKSVYMLRGGLDDWKDLVLFPVLPQNANSEQLAAFTRMKEISKFFGGTPRAEAKVKTDDAVLPLPKLQVPGTSPAPVTTPKKKKEGC